jgi:hypothetical protein
MTGGLERAAWAAIAFVNAKRAVLDLVIGHARDVTAGLVGFLSSFNARVL